MANKLLRFMAVAVVILALGGCAGGQTSPTVNFEQLLTTAGFTKKEADTPARLALLQKLPPRYIMPRKKDGKTHYLFADPDQRALYVGDADAYQRFLQLRTNQLTGPPISTTAELSAMEQDYESVMGLDQWGGAFDPGW